MNHDGCGVERHALACHELTCLAMTGHELPWIAMKRPSTRRSTWACPLRGAEHAYSRRQAALQAIFRPRLGCVSVGQIKNSFVRDAPRRSLASEIRIPLPA
jgi:hypothetical protein